MNPAELSALAFVSTSAGGTLALCRRDLHGLLAFTAGVMLGVVCFDLLPDAFGLAAAHGGGAPDVVATLVAGFVLCHALEKSMAWRAARAHRRAGRDPARRGRVAVLALVAHSFADGVGIGLAFQVSTAVGAAVALAVVAHDFCDGINLVGLVRGHGESRRRALALLALDAAAPGLGWVSTLVVSIPPAALAWQLGVVSGALLHVALADLLPRAHAQAGRLRTAALIGLTALGVVAARCAALALP